MTALHGTRIGAWQITGTVAMLSQAPPCVAGASCSLCKLGRLRAAGGGG